MNKPPCLNCNNNRKENLYCHMTCDKFAEYRKIQDKINENRRYGADATAYIVNNIYKFKKARNLPQYR